MIRLEHVGVVYGRTVALDDVDLEINSGITGVFGPNGAGKSTLLRVVAGLLAPTTGHATIEGRRISLADEWLRRKIGFAGHASGLYPRLSVAENLGLLASLYGVATRRADELLEAVGLSGFSTTMVGSLSAGLKHRAAVARALLHDPDVLLLDEPYANVDENASELLSAAVRDWWRPGRVELIATHGAKKVKRYADAGLILKDGRPAVHGDYRRPPAAPLST